MEDRMSRETYCQKCGRKRECSQVTVDTSGLHERAKKRQSPFNKLAKTKGSSLLSVCSGCAK